MYALCARARVCVCVSRWRTRRKGRPLAAAGRHTFAHSRYTLSRIVRLMAGSLRAEHRDTPREIAFRKELIHGVATIGHNGIIRAYRLIGPPSMRVCVCGEGERGGKGYSATIMSARLDAYYRSYIRVCRLTQRPESCQIAVRDACVTQLRYPLARPWTKHRDFWRSNWEKAETLPRRIFSLCSLLLESSKTYVDLPDISFIRSNTRYMFVDYFFNFLFFS